MNRKTLQAAALLLVGVLILVGLLRSVHPSEVASAISHASPGLVALGMLGSIGFLVLRGWRWKIILDASAPHARLSDATAVTAMGFAVNSVAAFKVGEILRFAAIAPRAGIAVGEAAGTVVIERVLDVIALLVLALAAAAASGSASAGGGLWGGVAAISALFVAIGIAAYVLVSNQDRAMRWWSRWTRRLPSRFQARAESLVASVLRGFTSLRSIRRLAGIFALSLALWMVAEAGLYAYFRALTPQLKPATLMLALTLFIISQAVSITPGSVGTYEGFFLLVFIPFGVRPAALVTAVAVISHVGGIVAFLAAGALGALWLRLSAGGIPVRFDRSLSSQDGA